MIIAGREIAGRIVGMIVGGLFLLALISFGLSQCQKRRSEAAQARVERSQAEAAAKSAEDAIGTVRRSGEAEKASEELTRSNEKEIRNAEGASDPVNSAVRDAGLRSLCRRPAYRNHERCKLLVAPAR
jgi:FtsZ-interacting cell division protein ZipA